MGIIACPAVTSPDPKSGLGEQMVLMVTSLPHLHPQTAWALVTRSGCSHGCETAEVPDGWRGDVIELTSREPSWVAINRYGSTELGFGLKLLHWLWL